jgi:hypothetical protein
MTDQTNSAHLIEKGTTTKDQVVETFGEPNRKYKVINTRHFFWVGKAMARGWFAGRTRRVVAAALC